MSADGNWKVDENPDGGLQEDDILRISSANGIQVDRLRAAWGTGYTGSTVQRTGQWTLTTSGDPGSRTLTAEKDGGEGDTWTAQEQVPPPPPPK